MALAVPLALLASALDPAAGASGAGGRANTGSPDPAPAAGAYRWGTVGHYALLGAGLYASDVRYEGAREPVEWRPGLPGPGQGQSQGAGELAEGMVALHRAAAGNATLRLLLPPETLSALGSTDVEGVALGIASLREAVRGDGLPGDVMYFALPPETRAALGEKLYAYDTPPLYGCFAACPDVEVGSSEGSDYETYLRGASDYSPRPAIRAELHGICAEANERLVGGVAWMEGDASWLNFMRDCGTWHSVTLSEAILEYMEQNVSPECKELIDAGWRVSNTGEFYPPERASAGNVGKPWVAGRSFGGTCLPDTYPLALPIRTGWYNQPQTPSPEHGDRAYRWGTVGHYALLGAGLYASDDRYEGAREPVERRPGLPGLGEGQGAGELAEGMVALHRAAAGNATLRYLLPPETLSALGSTDVEGVALGIASLREAVRGDDLPGDVLYFALPHETRAALGEKTYAHYTIPWYGCQLLACPDVGVVPSLGSDYESYLRSVRASGSNALLSGELQAICAEANERLVEEVAWMEGDASWLRFMRDCAYWHSGALSEAILEYMEASVSPECRGLIDAGWWVSDAGEFYPPERPGQSQARPARGDVDRNEDLWKPPFASRCLPEAYPLGLQLDNASV